MILNTRCFHLAAFFVLATSSLLRAQNYYTVQQIDQAKAEAHARHLPIAWLSSPMVYLNSNFANEAQGTPAELTGLALRTLQGQAVIIFQNADNDLPIMPANMIERIETRDEGNDLPHGWHYTAPKIIYTDPDLQTFFGCTLAPDLRSDRESAITIVLLHIRHDPQAQALINGKSAVAAAPSPPALVALPAAVPGSILGTVVTMFNSGSLFVYGATLLAALFAVVVFLGWRARS